MISSEVISKYRKIVDYYKLDQSVLNDIACAICEADKLFGTNDKKLDINRLLCSCEEFAGVSQKKCKQPLPDVQVLRVLCDTLIIGLMYNKNELDSDIHLTIPSSSKVASAVHISISGSVYEDELYCNTVIDSLLNSTVKDVLDPTIEYVMKFILKYDTSLDCRGLEIPAKYKSVGHLNGVSYGADDITVDSFLYNLATCLVQNYSKVSLARRMAISTKVDELQYRHRKEVVLALESGTLNVAKQGNHSLYSIISKLFYFTYSKNFVKKEGVLCLIYLLSMNPSISSVEFMKDLLFGEQEA